MVNLHLDSCKLHIVKELLEREGTINNYVILEQLNKNSKPYLRYAFINGYPKNKYSIPRWATELEIGKIYELEGWNGNYWMIKGSTPIDIEKLYTEKHWNVTIPEVIDICTKH